MNKEWTPKFGEYVKKLKEKNYDYQKIVQSQNYE